MFGCRWQLYFFILLFAYSPLGAKTLRMWHCVEIGDTDYLAADFKVTCDNLEWIAYALWAAVSCGMYIIGIPALFVALVNRQRNRHVEAYLFQIYGDGARKASVRAMRGRTVCEFFTDGIKCILRPITYVWEKQVLDRFIVMDPVRDIKLRKHFQDKAALKAVLEREKANLIDAARKDCADNGIATSKHDIQTAREFLHRYNLKAHHTQKQLGFLYQVRRHALLTLVIAAR